MTFLTIFCLLFFSLNAVREICCRCPLGMSEDLIQDLAQYKNHKDRSVMMAARSLIQLFRRTRPELLHKKDRGRPTEASAEHISLRYGEVVPHDHISGAEVLVGEENHKDEVDIGSESEDDDDDDSDGEWVDIKHSSDEEEIEGW